MKTERTTLYLNPKTKEKLKSTSEELGMNQSEIIRIGLLKHLKSLDKLKEHTQQEVVN